jgi:sRNA-binding carbon storage regulator CsrA
VHREEIYERIKREAQSGGGQVVRGQFGSGTDGKT